MSITTNIGIVSKYSVWDNLLHYYDFDETSGTSIADSVGSADGTTTNVTINQTGKSDKSIKFETTDGRVGFGSSIFDYQPSDSFSFSLWFKLTSTDSGYRGLINKRIKDTATHGYTIRFYSNKIYFVFNDTSTSISVYTNSTFTDTSNWHHLVVTYGGTSNSTKIYVDGTNQSVTDNGTSLSDYTASSVEFAVGNIQYDAGYNHSALAYIDEVGGWDRVLRSSEVSDLYNSGNGKFY